MKCGFCKHLVLALSFLAASGLAAQESEAAFFQGLFQSETSVKGQLTYLESLTKLDFEDAPQFYPKALHRLLLSVRNIHNDTLEQDAADNMGILLLQKVASLGAVGAAPDVMDTYYTFNNALVKSEALITLGKLGAKQYLPTIIQILVDTTTHPPTDSPQSGERIAYGAIQAIRSLGDLSGFVAVFTAENGWYSQWVKNAASDAVKSLAPDPFEPLRTIITSSSYSEALKVRALQTAQNSPKMPPEERVQLAILAGQEGWQNKSSDVRDLTTLSQLRKLSLVMMRQNGATEDAVYALCKQSYENGYDREEKLSSLNLLGSLKTDKAVDMLASFLADHNNMVINKGNLAKDDDLVRGVVMNLGLSENPKALNWLRTVTKLGYPSGIQALAQTGIEQITRATAGQTVGPATGAPVSGGN